MAQPLGRPAAYRFLQPTQRKLSPNMLWAPKLAGYKLLIIDELSYVPLSPTGAELLFEVFSGRRRL